MAVVTALNGLAQSDELLVKRAVGGDRFALEELFRRYRLVAYRVAFRMLGCEADALDAVQDGFIHAMTRLQGYQGRSSFKTWLLRVVTNAAIDLSRHRRRRECLSLSANCVDEPLPNETDPMAGLEREELRRLLDRALDTLSEAQRQTFVLYTDGELNYRDVAEVQGISIGTVMSRLYYARQKLRQTLEQEAAKRRD